MRLSGYQVVFVSALVGALFVVSGRVLVFLLDGRVAAIQSGWSNFAPFEGSGTIAVSAALAVGIAVFWNLMTDNEAAARRSARRSGNQILWLLRDSLAKNRMVEVTLKSNKCYVGYVHDTGVTAHRADPDIALIPMASGYRDDETSRACSYDVLRKANRAVPGRAGRSVVAVQTLPGGVPVFADRLREALRSHGVRHPPVASGGRRSGGDRRRGLSGVAAAAVHRPDDAPNVGCVPQDVRFGEGDETWRDAVERFRE